MHQKQHSVNNNDDTITDRGSTAGMEYGLDWICQNTATYRAPLEIFSLSSTVGLSTLWSKTPSGRQVFGILSEGGRQSQQCDEMDTFKPVIYHQHDSEGHI